MKKFAILLAIGLMLCAFSTANAALIGVMPLLQYPDIIFDNSGVTHYAAGTDTFTITAQDLKLVMSLGGTEYYLLGPGLNTAFSLTITVDNTGHIVGAGTMTETLTAGSVTIEGHPYTVGTTLLSGTVYDFGWGEGVLLGKFDFLLNTLGGALVTDGIWPSSVPTGIYAEAEQLNGWTGSWDADFTLNKTKGDKAPVPEPATMFLLGSGLLGLAGFARRKFKK